jgi:hypothetical protein
MAVRGEAVWVGSMQLPVALVSGDLMQQLQQNNIDCCCYAAFTPGVQLSSCLRKGSDKVRASNIVQVLLQSCIASLLLDVLGK